MALSMGAGQHRWCVDVKGGRTCGCRVSSVVTIGIAGPKRRRCVVARQIGQGS